MDRGAWRATDHTVANTIETTLYARTHLWAPIQGRKLQCHPAGGLICLCSSGPEVRLVSGGDLIRLGECMPHTILKINKRKQE